MTSQDPLRLCAFFQHMPPYSGAGALRGESILRALSEALANKGVMIEVFTTTMSPTPIPGVASRTINTPEVENSQGLVSRVTGEIRMGLVAAKEIFKRRDTCDFVVISSPGYLASLVLAAAARHFRVPYIVELRDIYPQVYADAGLISPNSFTYRFFIRRSERLYNNACAVIAATNGLARAVQESAPRTKVYKVYNGFPARLMRRQIKKNQRFTVCFHGVMGFFQDIELLLEVAGRLNDHDVDLLVVGYGRQEELIAQASLPNLQFLGRLTFDATISKIERCHVGLCLRKDEKISRDAFPVKVWEYMGLGMPCIVTPNCEAGDFLEKHTCGFQLPAGDADSIVEIILRLKQDKVALEEISRRCLDLAQSYTRENTGKQAANIIVKNLQHIYPKENPCAEI